VKKTVIVFVILLLLLSTIGYVTSKPINSSKHNNESYFYKNNIINIDQDIKHQKIDVIPQPMASRSLADSPWPMFGQNLNHTGLSQYNTSSNYGNMLWNFTTTSNFRSSPVIGPNGMIYVGCDDYNLYAIYPNGTKKWNFTTGYQILTAPAVDSNGIIYVASLDYLYAVYPNGTNKWQYFIGSIPYSSPAIISNGTIYIGCDDDLHAINPNGTAQWIFQASNWIWSPPAVDVNGTIYVGSWDKNLYAIYPNGTKKWNFPTSLSVRGAPAIGNDGTIYFGCSNTYLYALNQDGSKKWEYQTDNPVLSSPAIDSNGIIYIGSTDSKLYSVFPNGTLKWTFLTGDQIESTPAIGADGTIFIGSTDNKLYAIYPNGTQKWNFTTGHIIQSSPAIGAGGTIYFGSSDNNLYALGSDLVLTNSKVQPQSGFTKTYFNYTVNYIHYKNKPPSYVKINIDNVNYSMIETDTSDTNYLDGKLFFYNISKLNIGTHKHQFWASDGSFETSTLISNRPVVFNTPPEIATIDNTSAYEGLYYENTYEFEDIDRENIAQVGTWNHSTNATWLSFNPTTVMLYGIPTNDDVGTYWVNISINDTIDMDFTNFTLTVINENDNPIIETTDVEITYEDELYEVDYNASDVDSLISNQIWLLDTNATLWLNIESISGIISGTPTNDEVGEYWVNVSVDDGDSGLAFTNYTLIVLNVNDRPEILTEDELTTHANTLYFVDYNASDIDSPLSQLIWSLNTNATWLDLDTSTGVLSGTPTNSDVGWYNVNITVDDGDTGQDWHDFILTVTSEGFENNPPEITTIDQVSITAGKSYNVIYEAIDDRTPLESLTWSYNSNASWLSFNKITRTLSGNPTLSDVGWYWVNVTVFDGEGGFDSHNFTLMVWATANEPPDILTDNEVNAVVSELYSVDYEAEDDHTPFDKLLWSLETNASDWLDIDPETGVLSGTPELDNVGSYWVKVSVFDNEDGWDHANFTLWVTTVAITEYPPQLSNPSMTPSTGDTNTEFTFSVDYSHPDDDLPDSIEVVIDGNAYDMESTNGHYEYSTKLSEGNHTYYFTTKLGEFKVDTGTFNTGYITKVEDPPEDGDGDGDEDNTMLFAIIGIIVVIIVVLILLFIFLKRKKGKEEEPPVEEAMAPAPDEVPPEVPPEQVPTPETPPSEQPPTPEIPPEQVPAPETPPTEQPPEVQPEHVPLPETPQPEQPQVPEVTTEQPPTPEVTPQVPQPQVEPAPEPASMEEQPAPQPQAEPQPQGQAPVPNVKNPIIEEEY
jgi:outer membrane protein assembly factor BamB